jgi:hypothetical protein
LGALTSEANGMDKEENLRNGKTNTRQFYF